MRATFALFVLALVTALATGAFSGAAEGQAPTPPAQFETSFSDFTPTTVQRFAAFPLYSVGSQFENLPLTRITRTFNRPNLSAVGAAAFSLPDNRTNYVNFIYGTCTSRAGEGGCAPPLTVQVWPACDRTLADYYYNMPQGVPSREYERVTLRGVPAAKFADGMLEIYSGRVTIVIFGDTDTLRLRAAENLVPVNDLAGAVSRGEPLPPPAGGAMEGKLAC